MEKTVLRTHRVSQREINIGNRVENDSEAKKENVGKYCGIYI